MEIVKYFLKNKEVQFAQGSGGNTATSRQELEVHDTVEDCWVILHGNVYDLMSSADRHTLEVTAGLRINVMDKKEPNCTADAFQPPSSWIRSPDTKLDPMRVELG
jgi:hypothetical protein